MGVRYNAPSVLTQITNAIKEFKTGKIPVKLPAAAIQADVVVHSLGGLMTRYLPLVKGFTHDTLGQGVVNKLITINTPHLGTPLATRFMQQQGFTTRCVARVLTAAGSIIVRRVRPEYDWVDSAIFDLTENSPIVTDLANMNVRAFPTARVASTYDNWVTMDIAGLFVKQVCPDDDVAQAMTGTGWRVLMKGENDGVVNINSQQAGVAFPPVEFFPRRAHTDALSKVGFVGPYVTTDAEVSQRVIDLLNTPLSSQVRMCACPRAGRADSRRGHNDVISWSRDADDSDACLAGGHGRGVVRNPGPEFRPAESCPGD